MDLCHPVMTWPKRLLDRMRVEREERSVVLIQKEDIDACFAYVAALVREETVELAA